MALAQLLLCALFLFSSASGQAFTNPLLQTSKPTWELLSYQTIAWTVSSDFDTSQKLNLVFWQDVAGDSNVFVGQFQGSVTTYDWLVQTLGKNLTVSRSFFFQMFVNGATAPLFTSGKFNIADAPSAASSSLATATSTTSVSVLTIVSTVVPTISTSASSSSTQASSTSASIASTTTSNSEATAASTTGGLSTGVKAGIGAGIGVGVPLFVALGIFLGLRLRKHVRNSAPPLPPAGPYEAAGSMSNTATPETTYRSPQFYDPSAMKPPYQQSPAELGSYR